MHAIVSFGPFSIWPASRTLSKLDSGGPGLETDDHWLTPQPKKLCLCAVTLGRLTGYIRPWLSCLAVVAAAKGRREELANQMWKAATRSCQGLCSVSMRCKKAMQRSELCDAMWLGRLGGASGVPTGIPGQPLHRPQFQCSFPSARKTQFA